MSQTTKEEANRLIEIATSKSKAVEELAKMDHAIVGGKFARAVGKAFDVKIEVGSMQDTRSQFKGATIDGAEEGEIVNDLIDASSLATQLCRKAGVKYAPMYGRGSQLRACVEALRASL